MITMKERHEMKYMGETIKAVFERPNKTTFPKYFYTEEQCEEFTAGAEEYGNKRISKEVLA